MLDSFVFKEGKDADSAPFPRELLSLPRTPIKSVKTGVGREHELGAHDVRPGLHLAVGEGEMGGFAKDWLYEKRATDQPAAAPAP